MGFRPPSPRRPVAHAAPDPPESAGQNGPRAHARFEGGNLEAAEWVSPSHLRFTARGDASPRPLWFYFCLEQARVPSVLCDLVNADDCFGPRRAWAFARPVYSSDGRTWHRVERADYVAPGDGPGTFRFSVPVLGPQTRVAYCHPYTTRDLQDCLHSLIGLSGISVETCGATPEARPLPLVRSGSLAAGAPVVWVLGRQHAGETPASWVIDGILRTLARLDATGSRGGVVVTPMIDPDGVYHGRYGKDERPVDFNRDWCPAPARAETCAVLAAVRRTQARNPIELVLDVHASHHGDTECYLFGEAQGRTVAGERQARFVENLARRGPATIGLRAGDLRFSSAPPRSARGYLAQLLGCPALTLEVSYHLTQSGRYPGVKDYCDLGAAVASALMDLLKEPRAA